MRLTTTATPTSPHRSSGTPAGLEKSKHGEGARLPASALAARPAEKARNLSRQIQEEIYYSAMVTTIELAEQSGPCHAFPSTRAAKGE